MIQTAARKLKAKMVLRGLSLAEVSKLSGVDYSYCSRILNGKMIDPERFRKIRRSIESAPIPQEVAA